MLALYLNCKITYKSLIKNSSASGYFYPIVYPQKNNYYEISQYEILLKTLESYTKLKFTHAIFNIEIVGITKSIKNELELIIKKINAKYIKINYIRPSTKDAWIEDIKKNIEIVGKNCPVLVVMNHDHPFVDYTDRVFIDLVNSIFSKNNTNFQKTLYYSHAPESVSWALNSKIGTLYKLIGNNVYKSQPINNWLDGYSIMSLETLQHIFSKANCKDIYLGRFDWPGVKYNELNLTNYIYPREFFRHFDGYGHVTGIRLFSNNIITDINKHNDTNKFNKEDLINFYYQKWIDTFLLMIRDKIHSESIFLSERNLFIAAVENSINIFNQTYVLNDIKYNLILDFDEDEILLSLKNKIYYSANYIFYNIVIDNKLSRISYINRIRSILLINKLIIKLKFITNIFLKIK